MDRISCVKRVIPQRHAVAVLLLSALWTPIAQAEGNENIQKTAENVPYVSGGIGIDAIDRLDAMAGQFNVKLVFASQSGEYLSDIKITITDAAGTIVLDTLSEGPWVMTKLRSGRYQVVALYEGRTEKRPLVVGTAKLNTLDFRWNTR